MGAYSFGGKQRVRGTGQDHFPLPQICWPVPRTRVIPAICYLFFWTFSATLCYILHDL